MVTDLDLDQHKDIHLDGANDLALTSGIEQLEQSVAIDVMDELQDFIGGRVTGQNIGMLEARIQQALDDDPQIASVRSVNISEYNQQTETLSIDIITVENEDFSLEVSP